MTWLPLADSEGTERDAVLALQPEASARWLAVLDRTWAIVDPELLDLCRLRIAQLHECRAELERADAGLLARLESWTSEAAFGPRERAALSYAEQFVIDQNGISDEQKAELSRHLTRRELSNFVQALNSHDGYLRTLSLLDVAPDPGRFARPDGGEPAETGDPEQLPEARGDLWLALTDRDFYDRRSAFGAATALLHGVDAVTTELCRLRNASHQACSF